MGHDRAARSRRGRSRFRAAGGAGGALIRRAPAALGLVAALVSCEPVGVDLEAVVALTVFLPDSGVVEENDTILPRAVALNGRGDSIAAEFAWATLDTANLRVLDSATGATLGLSPESGRLQVRVGSLRSGPVTVIVRPQADTIFAAGAQRGTVVASTSADSLSDALAVRVEDRTTNPLTPAPLANRPVIFALAYPATPGAFRLEPGDTVSTGTDGVASVRVRLLSRALPDSAVVQARAVRGNGQTVPGSDVTFVVEFLP